MSTAPPVVRTSIATVKGVFLAPGVSANNRLYSRPVIEGAVKAMKKRLADPNGRPLTMQVYHPVDIPGGDSRAIAGRITKVAVIPETGAAVWEGELANSAAGRDMLALTSPGPDGKRHLDGVSIRGRWTGPTRYVTVRGKAAETADSLEIDGIDFTSTPGVSAARITSVVAETHPDRRLIVETAPRASVQVTEARLGELLETFDYNALSRVEKDELASAAFAGLFRPGGARNWPGRWGHL